MKRCKCEHWQTCPTCYPQGFDEHGARKPVEIPSSREELQREITELREQVEKQSAALKMAREALQGIHPGNMTPMAEKNWIEALAAIDATTQEDKP